MRPGERTLSVLGAVWWAATVVCFVIDFGTGNTLFGPLFSVPGYGTVGGLLAVRRPRSPFGWLLLVMASVPMVDQFVLLTPELQNAIPIIGIALVLVLFPTGRPPSRVWLIPMGLVVVSWPSIGHVGTISLPGDFALDVSVVIAGLSLMVCGAAPFVRFRRSEGVERAQLQWLGAAALATAIAAGVMAAGLATGFEPLTGFGGLAAALLFAFGIPGAILLSVLRHRLYEIDRVLGRAFTYAIAVGVLTVAYAAMVIGVGALVEAFGPSTEDLGIPLPIIATALVGVGFQPVRVRARRLADRLVYGRRSTPYEALASVSGATASEVLPQIARAATESTSARRSIAWLSNGIELRPAAAFPEEGPFPDAVAFDGEVVPATLSGGIAVALRHHGELLGAIEVLTGPGEALAENDVRLLGDLAAHAAVALRSAFDAVSLPTGTVTFLMTDIEGSTRLWEEDAETMGATIRRHDALMRSTVADNGGLLIKWRGEGDSTFSVFSDATTALRAAVAVQAAITAEPWETSRPIRVRAALHTGEAELRERDYFGRTVNRCARLRALAVGGQTLLSSTTRELVRDGLPAGLAIADLGERTLKDIAEPEHVFEVLARGADEPEPTPAGV
jgi:class 3 adenylate cyclase